MSLEDVLGKAFRTTCRFAAYLLSNCYFNRPELRGAEHLDIPGPKILAANHMGDMFDPILLWTYAGRKLDNVLKYAGKKELFDYVGGMSGILMRGWNCVPVDRKKPGGIIDTFVGILENGGKYDGALAIHFEGTTTPRGELVAKAKTGFARAALRVPGTHVIPTSICYQGGIYHAFPAFRAHPIMELLPPIEVRPWKERYDQYEGHPEAQHTVAEDLTQYVKALIVDDLRGKGVEGAPGIEGLY